ncbi:MAG: hypothetical protein ACRDX8_08805 [Acidimicrobiales bacterium]
MASRVYSFNATVEADTPAGSPTTTPTEFAPGTVGELELVFPDGCAGLVGVRITNAYGQVIPYAHGQWIRGNNEVLRLPLEGYIQSGSWQVEAYNEDAVYPHTLMVRYLVTEVGSTEQPPAALINPTLIEPPTPTPQAELASTARLLAEAEAQLEAEEAASLA